MSASGAIDARGTYIDLSDMGGQGAEVDMSWEGASASGTDPARRMAINLSNMQGEGTREGVPASVRWPWARALPVGRGLASQTWPCRALRRVHQPRRTSCKICLQKPIEKQVLRASKFNLL